MSNPAVQRVLLAGRKESSERDDALANRMEELAALCEAAGGEVVGTYVQQRPELDPATYLGAGKIAEISEAVDQLEVELVVFDAELSPGQVRNLEQRLGCRVIDRTQLILDIFAQRAQSREGRLQVEIAQLQYLLPRLTGRGAALSRLGGGIGTRGPGETKLESDRRRIRQRINHLRAALRHVQKTRATQRQRRIKSVPVVALVGYTNAGKSTLLQRWTADRGTDTTERGHQRLFDTLDPVARRVTAPSGQDYVVLDTVGFVRDLPHLLVEAFRATLEEVLAADVIVHVVDGSEPTDTGLQTSHRVLAELGAASKPIVTFFNKLDKGGSPPGPDVHALVSVYGSARSGEGVARLYDEVERLLELDVVQLVFRTRLADDGFWSLLAQVGRVQAVAADGDVVQVVVAAARRQAMDCLCQPPAGCQVCMAETPSDALIRH